MIREVLLAVRLTSSIYFFILSFGVDQKERGVFMALIAVYFSLSAITYFSDGRFREAGKFLDIPFLPFLIYLSGTSISVFALIPQIVLHTRRNAPVSIVLLAIGLMLTAFYYHSNVIHMLSVMVLMVSSPVSALVPDLTALIKKEREEKENLRKSYKRLISDYGRWERDRRELEAVSFLIDTSTESPDVRDFLKRVKERFGIKRVHILPKREIGSEDSYMDRERGLLSVPVRLEEGGAVVIFEMEEAVQLNDDLVVSTLKKAGRMINLYIQGFTDEAYPGKAINIV